MTYICSSSTLLAGQSNEPHKALYKAAYNEINLMLEGKTPIKFKRAVFLMENAYLENKLNYDQFNTEISSIAKKLHTLIQNKHIERYKTAANWAVFTYMVDSISENEYHPYLYDFQDQFRLNLLKKFMNRIF